MTVFLKKFSTVLCCLLLVFLLALPAQALVFEPEDSEIQYSTDEVLIKYKKNSETNIITETENENEEDMFIDELAHNYKLWSEKNERNNPKKIKKKFKKIKKIKKTKKRLNTSFALLKLEKKISKSQLKKLIRRMNSETFGDSHYQIEAVYPNYTYEISNIVNDPMYSNQWAHQVVQPEILWDYTKGKGAVIAVIDTGVDYTHEDLAENIWVNTDEIPSNGKDDDNNGYIDDVRGWDFVDLASGSCIGIEDCRDEDNDPKDINGHGTHVAGIIAAVQNNEKGVSGIAPEAQIMPLKAGYSVGFSAFLKTSDILEAITYAINNDADVINMSFAGYGLALLNDILDLADSLGIVTVAAAGNNSSNVKIYPAAIPSVIAVGALADQSSKAHFSNYGDWVDIVAPGSWLLSTVPGNKYEYKSGTSMAAPVVAGVAALIKAKNKVSSISSAKVKELLLSSTIETSFPIVRGGTETIGGVSAAIDFGLSIDSLSIPNRGVIGETLSFSVTASDPDSIITEYEWSSDLDGFLSNEPNFSSNELSLGSHAITVRVRNSEGEWSEPQFKILNISEFRNTDTLNLVDTISFRMRRRQKRFYAGLSKESRKKIKSYKWISNKDGTVSEKRSFGIEKLSSGLHQLSLLIQDKDGNWSSPYERIIEI